MGATNASQWTGKVSSSFPDFLNKIFISIIRSHTTTTANEHDTWFVSRLWQFASRAGHSRTKTQPVRWLTATVATSGLANQVSDKKLRFTFHHLSPHHGAIWQEMIGNKYENQNLIADITCKMHRTFKSIAMEQNEAHFWFTADIFFDVYIVYGLLSSFLQSHYDLLSFLMPRI